MNEKLRELYYKEDVIIGSKQNFINLAKKSLNASTKEINEFLKKLRKYELMVINFLKFTCKFNTE